jgi:hypothetical protein
LSAWWISLGIKLVRSRLASPQDNGAHERMHKDIRSEVQSQPAPDVAAQQRVLDKWRQTFNHVRPHDALKGKTPADVYKVRSKKPLHAQPWNYPFGLTVVRVGTKGVLRYRSVNYFLSVALARRDVGIEVVDAFRIRVWFCDCDLGTIDIEPEVDEALYENFRSFKKHVTKLAA